jgi:hypothetical protein
MSKIPNLVDVIPEASTDLILRLRRELSRVLADADLVIARRMTAAQAPCPSPDRAVGIAEADVLTVDRLAKLWGMKPGKVRELCRTGQLPARKLGREWVVPLALLAMWVKKPPLAEQVTGGYNDSHEPDAGQSAPPRARPYRVEVRRLGRRASGHGQAVGGWPAAGQPDGRTPDAVAGGAD